MRHNILASLACSLVCVGAVFAQDVSSPGAAFRGASFEAKRDALVQIILHERSGTPQELASIIGAGLGDDDARIRQGALAAVTSRASGPHVLKSDVAARQWQTDRNSIQALRAQVQQAVEDPVESVRLEAVSAMAALDFDPAMPAIELRPATVNLLIRRFYADASPQVRARIVGGFSTDGTVDSAGVQRLLVDAFADGDKRVRHAASFGAERLGADGIPLLVNQLRDREREVRMQAAFMLTKSGAKASGYLSQVEEAVAQERDAVVRQRMQGAISAIRKSK
jgi:hypothetical protein